MSKKSQIFILSFLFLSIFVLVAFIFALSRYGAFWRKERGATPPLPTPTPRLEAVVKEPPLG